MATPAAPAPDLRPLRVGEILDVGIKVYTRNAKTLFALVALVIIPVQIIGVLVIISTIPDALAAGSQNPFEVDPTAPVPTFDGGEFLIYIAGTLVVALLGFVSTTIATGACFKAVADAYLGSRPEWRQSLRYAFTHLRSLLWVVFLSSIATGFGLLLCLIPGIWLAIIWAVAIPVLLTEGTRGTKALGRSFNLVQPRFWPVCAVVVISYGIRMVVNSAIGGGVVALTFTDIGQNVFLTQVLSGAAGALAAIIATPFQAAVIAVLYFDLRVRQEGFDLQLLAQRMGMSDPSTAHAALLPPVPAPVQYAPGVPPPPVYTPPPANGLAIASLIASLLLCIGSIPAVIMGHIAKRQIDRSGGTQGGRGVALAGIIIGWVGCGILVIAGLGMLAAQA